MIRAVSRLECCSLLESGVAIAGCRPPAHPTEVPPNTEEATGAAEAASTEIAAVAPTVDAATALAHPPPSSVTVHRDGGGASATLAAPSATASYMQVDASRRQSWIEHYLATGAYDAAYALGFHPALPSATQHPAWQYYGYGAATTYPYGQAAVEPLPPASAPWYPWYGLTTPTVLPPPAVVSSVDTPGTPLPAVPEMPDTPQKRLEGSLAAIDMRAAMLAAAAPSTADADMAVGSVKEGAAGEGEIQEGEIQAGAMEANEAEGEEEACESEEEMQEGRHGTLASVPMAVAAAEQTWDLNSDSDDSDDAEQMRLSQDESHGPVPSGSETAVGARQPGSEATGSAGATRSAGATGSDATGSAGAGGPAGAAGSEATGSGAMDDDAANSSTVKAIEAAWFAKRVPDAAERASPWACYLRGVADGHADGYTEGHHDADRDIHANACAMVPALRSELANEHGRDVDMLVAALRDKFEREKAAAVNAAVEAALCDGLEHRLLALRQYIEMRRAAVTSSWSKAAAKPWRIVIRRSSLVADVLGAFGKLSSSKSKHPSLFSSTAVQFVSAHGVLEDGDDQGGLTAEMYSSFWKEAVNPEAGLFQQASEGGLLLPAVGAPAAELEALGLLLVKSIIDEYPIGRGLCHMTFECLVHDAPLSLSTVHAGLYALREYDPSLATSWKLLLDDQSHPLDELGLTCGDFDEDADDDAQPVTSETLADAVLAGCRHRLLGVRRSAFDHLRRGFTMREDLSLQLSAVRVADLAPTLQGKISLTASELLACFELPSASDVEARDAGFGDAGSAADVYFEAMLRDEAAFDEGRRLALLQWCTALGALPAGGLREHKIRLRLYGSNQSSNAGTGAHLHHACAHTAAETSADPVLDSLL